MKAYRYTIIPTINKQGFNVVDEKGTKVKFSEIDLKIKLTPEFFNLVKLENEKLRKNQSHLNKRYSETQKGV